MSSLANMIEYAAQLLNETDRHWEYQNDVIWDHFRSSGKWYAFKERVAHQISGWSDLNNAFVIRHT